MERHVKSELILCAVVIRDQDEEDDILLVVLVGCRDEVVKLEKSAGAQWLHKLVERVKFFGREWCYSFVGNAKLSM